MPLTQLIQSHPSDAQQRMMRLRAFYAAGGADAYEHLCAALKLALGAWLLLPLHTFASSPRAYRLVSAFAPEWGWGLFWCAAGAAQFLAWYYDARPLRFWVNGLGAVLWGGYGVLLVISDPRSPALAFFGPLAVYQTLTAAWLRSRCFPASTGNRNAGNRPADEAPTPRPSAGRPDHDGED